MSLEMLESLTYLLRDEEPENDITRQLIATLLGACKRKPDQKPGKRRKQA